MDPSGLAGLGFLFAFLVIGAIFLGYPLACLVLGFYVHHLFRGAGKNSRAAVVAGFLATSILLLLPFADYPLLRHRLDKFCAAEGGLHIRKSVEAVEGVHGLRHAIQYGYSFGEDYSKPGDHSTLRRYYAAPPGSNRGFLEVKADKVSPHGLHGTRVRVEGDIYRVTRQTYMTDTKEELGRFVYFENDPREQGWSINDLRQWMRMTCKGVEPGGIPQVRELLQKTLIPVRMAAK